MRPTLNKPAVSAVLTVGAGAVLAAAAIAVRRLIRRSGVAAADLATPIPGDGLVAQPTFTVDRAAVLSAPPAAVWPWLMQLGKERGWWYLPAWAERLVWAPDKRGARRIVPELQGLAIGDIVPDWGPGTPVFKVAELDPPHALVYHSLRQRSNGWRWPEPDTPRPPDCFEFSWALVLNPLPADRSRLHIRLRAATSKGRMTPFLEVGGGLVDYVTVMLLFRGLEERLTSR